MTDTPTIRTHQATLDGDPACDQAWAYLPADWPDDIESVLVVAGLPEGATIRRLCDLPDDRSWEWMNSSGCWQTASLFEAEGECEGLVVCRPKPVPAPPATERVLVRDAYGRFNVYGERINAVGQDQDGPWYEVDGDILACRPLDGMVEVLVEAPTGDDEPHHAPFCGLDTDHPGGCEVVERDGSTGDGAGDDEPQADTPTPQGRERIDSRIEFVYTLLGERAPSDIDIEAGTADAPWWIALRDAFDDLVELVRRDGTAPDLTPLFDALDAYDRRRQRLGAGAGGSHEVLAVVRALRDGGAR